MTSVLWSVSSAYVVEYDQLICPPALEATDRIEDAVSRHCGNQLLHEQHQQYRADYG